MSKTTILVKKSHMVKHPYLGQIGELWKIIFEETMRNEPLFNDKKVKIIIFHFLPFQLKVGKK